MINENKETLKPCPFCGDTATLWHTQDNHHSPYVKCDGSVKTDGTKKCFATQYPWNFKTDKEAIDAWNRRTHND